MGQRANETSKTVPRTKREPGQTNQHAAINAARLIKVQMR
jgi:hypothetical protein